MLPTEFPRNQTEPGWAELRTKLMDAAAAVLADLKSRGRQCNTEVLICEVADRAGVELVSQREYTFFMPWAAKALEMAEYQAELAQKNGGQFALF